MSRRAETDRRVTLRMTRQKLLTEPDSPQIRACSTRPRCAASSAPTQVMREQLEHLAAHADLPNVTLQVLPFDRGSRAAAAGPFTMLQFAEDDLPDIVYIEQLTSAVYLDKRAEVELYRAAMDRIAAAALTPAESRTLLVGPGGAAPVADGSGQSSAVPAPGSSSRRPPSGPGRARCARRAPASARRPGRTPPGPARGTASTR